MHLMIVTPIFPPATGGAATYYGTLSRELLASGGVRRITIITERFPGESAQTEDSSRKLRVVRLFPHRAGGALGVLGQGTRYCLQNLQYPGLLAIVEATGVNAVVVHSSFHNLPNLLGTTIARLPGSVLRIADVRDHQMPATKLAQLEVYDRIIACSENVAEHLARHAVLRERVRVIPIPQDTLLVADTAANRQIVADAGLEPERYILFAGLFKRRKGVELLLDAHRTYQASALRAGAPMLTLAFAGVVKERAFARRAARMPGVRILGPLERARLLALMRFAALNVNLSSSEGMPRACLEALALGTRVILPPGIPEFRRYCGPWVAASDDDPEVLARQFGAVLSQPPPAGYPLEQHSIDHVLPRYIEVLMHTTPASCYRPFA
jgi:glycosyltransferase involved in cell wall biosynthesis